MLSVKCQNEIKRRAPKFSETDALRHGLDGNPILSGIGGNTMNNYRFWYLIAFYRIRRK